MIEVTTGFEGANPADPSQIKRVHDASFVIRPYSEDGDGNYKFAMLLHVVNPTSEPVRAEFVIDWDDPVHMSCRDYVLLGKGARCRWFPVEIQDGAGRAQVSVPPGRHELALQPTYGRDQLRALQRRAERSDNSACAASNGCAFARPENRRMGSRHERLARKGHSP